MRVVFIARQTFQLFPQLCYRLASLDEVEEIVWLTNTDTKTSEAIFKAVPKDVYEKSYVKNVPKLKIIKLYHFNKPLHITLTIQKFLRCYKPDLVVYHYGDGFAGVLYGKKAVVGGFLALPLLMLSRLSCKHILFWISNLDASPIMQVQSKLLYPLFSKLINRVMVNEESQASLLSKLGFERKRICIMPEPPLLTYDQYSDSVRQDHTANNIIFCFGAIEKRKGLHLLIHAMPAILDKHPNTQLIIAGPAFDPLYVDELNRLAAEEKSSTSVKIIARFLSNEELVQFIRTANIIGNLQEESPSPAGTLGITAAFGKCTIVSNTSLFKRHIRDKYNGRIVRRNVQEIADCFNEVLGSSVEQKRMGENLYNTFHRSHNWNRIIELMMMEFKAILADQDAYFQDYDICLKDINCSERV